MEKIKIAEFFGEPLNYGGQESFILNFYQNANTKDVEFTFLTPFEVTNKELKELVEERKEKILGGNNEFDSKFRKKYIINYAKETIDSSYDIVHIHSGSLFTLYQVAKIAKRKGVERVVIHSHATGKTNLKYKIIKFVSDKNILKYVDCYLACSDDAAMWKFPSKIINEKRYIVINNGINIDKFRFNSNSRRKIRKEYGISDDTKVLINVGRLSEEKNQELLLKVVKALNERSSKVLLFLIGDGPLKEKLKTEIEELDIQKSVLMIGNKSNVNEYLSASDCFLFPSYYEGLGISAIEAQTSGLMTICSDKVPETTKISDECYFINFDIEKWVELIEKCSINGKRICEDDAIQKYDVKRTAKELLDIYYKLVR